MCNFLRTVHQLIAAAAAAKNERKVEHFTVDFRRLCKLLAFVFAVCVFVLCMADFIHQRLLCVNDIHI